MKISTKRIISAGSAILALSLIAIPAAASQFSYNFNTETPAWQQPAAVGQDRKTISNHFGQIYFSYIEPGYRATAEMCSYTVGGVDCTLSQERTDLSTGVDYRIPSGFSAGADTFFRLRTNTITTERVSMLGRSTTF